MIGLLAPLALALGGCPPTPNSDIVCDPNGCISLSKFTNNIINALTNNVTGYVAIVGDSLGGGIPLAGGLARTSTDGSILSMNNFRLLTNIASVSKLMTTIAVLKSLSAHNLTLDTKIARYIYPDWPRDASIDTITFRDLLSHRSGFRDSCGATTYWDLKAQIQKGVDTTLIGTAQYCNGNFGIFREMLPLMEGQIAPRRRAFHLASPGQIGAQPFTSAM
jgi:hypothetical protein